MELFAHPFSSYCQKVLVALYEYELPFDYRVLGADAPENGAELIRHWPMGKFPVLVDEGRPVMESSIIIEYLQNRHPEKVRLVPDHPDAALEVRLLDRIFDNHVMATMQSVVNDSLRPPERRDPESVREAKLKLGTIYRWLDGWLTGREWAASGAFSLADCAAAPALFYADWVSPIPDDAPRLKAYRARLLARPSFARAVEEARPYRPLFPLGAPDRD